jgi:hypothetical protein
MPALRRHPPGPYLDHQGRTAGHFGNHAGLSKSADYQLNHQNGNVVGVFFSRALDREGPLTIFTAKLRSRQLSVTRCFLPHSTQCRDALIVGNLFM